MSFFQLQAVVTDSFQTAGMETIHEPSFFALTSCTEKPVELLFGELTMHFMQWKFVPQYSPVQLLFGELITRW
jgi:hypothetical protein